MRSWKKGLFIGLFSSMLWEQQSVQVAVGLSSPTVQEPFLFAFEKNNLTPPPLPIPIWEPPRAIVMKENILNHRVLQGERRLQTESELPLLASREGLLLSEVKETPVVSREKVQTRSKAAVLKKAPLPSRTTQATSNPAPTINSVSGAKATPAGMLVSVAVKYQGTPYLYGGTTPRGFDCSGFIQFVFQKCGISLPRTTYEQVGSGVPVGRSQLQPGDLVFFSCGGSGTSHAGIYLGDGRFVHADQSRGVVIAELSDNYWSSVYQTGVRVR